MKKMIAHAERKEEKKESERREKKAKRNSPPSGHWLGKDRPRRSWMGKDPTTLGHTAMT